MIAPGEQLLNCMHFNAGDRVDHYVIIEKLGSGGMSEVYRARDEQQARDVVLKFPHDDMMGDPATYERFRREVKIGKLLTHPHIQKLFDLGGDQHSPYLVLEYLDGCTLRSLLRSQHRLAMDVVCTVGVQLTNALGYAHSHHVFHRDLKPENVIMTADGQAKVMDFGIAFVPGARRVTWGSLSSQVGTPDYMAPEQIKGVRGDTRTDIYALGTILYECIAGRLPYRGDNPLSVMNQHVTMSPPPIHQFFRDVPQDLEEVIMKAIRRDPNARWPSMQAFGEAIAHPDTVDAGALAAEREQQEQAVMPAPAFGEFGRPMWQVIVIVAVILIGIVAVGVVAQLLHHA